MELTIECQKRAPGSKPNALRRGGLIPAVLYGHNGAESVELALNSKTAESLVKKASLNNTVIQLNITDLPWSGKTLLKEVQSHPWKGNLYHLSFFSIGSQGSLTVTVPIHFSGEAVGVKTFGGILDTVIMQLEVQSPPDRIPESIEVDVSELNVGDSLHVNQLPLPEGVVALGEGERVVVSVLQSKTAQQAEADQS
ncbi:50S ribosomal protein L25/general stress protein Ctc [Oscillatoria sp. FACHB-1407]|uniref:50S ribosomal protein L25/general stress protein Ctc n=1 Tax=Oscillatoria sp. FACHB-1407 TaxID=2692847 RepID=UPI00168314EC|nr:50S ribosomal protein L25/general stress protein Ctc [Oscillatoria sp. FACHB-1407]MBD2459967.1 50S ribosomal protein L25/general stress protein Ctc [Oscillatoria sp. FACHB-1407]